MKEQSIWEQLMKSKRFSAPLRKKRLEHTTTSTHWKTERIISEIWTNVSSNSRWKTDWGKMMASGDTSNSLKIKRKITPNKSLIYGKSFQEFLKDLSKFSRKSSQNSSSLKLKKSLKKPRSPQNLLRSSSESTQNVWELWNFAAITSNWKMKETIKFEACFPMTWLKEEEERPNSILELRTLHLTSITSSKLTIRKVALSHLDNSTKN